MFQHHANLLCDELYRIHSRGVSDPDSAYSQRGVDMQDYFLRFTMDSFARIGFGMEDMHSISAETNRFAEAFDYVQSRCFNRMDYGEWWPWIVPKDDKFKRHLAYMDQVVYDCIGRARQRSQAELLAKQLHEPDLLTQTLLDMTDDEGRPNDQWSEEVMRDTVMNFLIAGRDTTALMLSWFFYQLASHPEVEARILDEMDRVIGGAGGEVTYESMKQMVYLQSALQESLRIYPSVPFNGFTALRDDVLPGGFFVPKDTYVVYSAYLLHRRADLYPDPLTFDPSRFDRKPPKPFEYMSFHGGPRECLGREMAFLEAKIMIVTLLGRGWTLRMKEGQQVELKRAIILTARKGIRMQLIVPEEAPRTRRRRPQAPPPRRHGSVSAPM